MNYQNVNKYFKISDLGPKFLSQPTRMSWWHTKLIWVQRLRRLFNTRFLRIQNLPRIPIDANVMHYDHSHMGTFLVRGWDVLHEGNDETCPLEYIILHNQRTGKRFKVFLPQD